MKTEKIAKKVTSALDALRGSDPVVMKKKIVMEDSLYRKNTPGREIAHAECVFHCSFCLLTVAALTAHAAPPLALCRLCRRP
ncbi:MAG: hypothetical protein MJ096_03925 [Clostridia bacterium]|nr:hypothetical protein [Clostridia bacterium]